MPKMRKIFICLLTVALTLTLLAGCSQQASSSASQPESPAQPSNSSQPEQSSASQAAGQPSVPSGSEPDEMSSQPQESDSAPEETESGKTLVVYFSASGNTKEVAQTIADTLGADLYELVPAEPYTSDDLNWRDSDSRVNKEHEDPSHRTAIAGTQDLSGYDTIFIGYPLWWQQAPSIVWNFVENSDLAGKTMIPFCTSTSSPFGTSGDTLAGMAPDAQWLDGMRFGESLNEAAVKEWVNSLNLVSAA